MNQRELQRFTREKYSELHWSSAVIAVAVSKECQPSLLPATARQAIARYARALRMELRAMLRNTRLRQSMSQTQLIAQIVRAVVRA
jgi:hypothetical protein